MKRRMLLIFNPRAGLQRFPQALFDVVDTFSAAGFLVTAYPTQAPGEVKQMIQKHVSEMDYLVVSGGDGTVAEAIGALLPLPARPVFAIIPSGTVNDFTASLGLPKEILQAAEVVVYGKEKPLDIGRFGNKYFSYVAAFGLFTDVSYETPQNMKNMLGNLAYFLEGVKRLGAVQPCYCTFDLDGEVISGEFILGLISNSLSVGGIKLPDTEVKMDDGLLEIILLPRPENILDVMGIISSLVQQEGNNESLIIRKAKKITVKGKTHIAWTLDGEYGGMYKNVSIENMHHAIKIMMP
jgi:YegS/Rv2252/BmrU family lipid kinase